MFPGLLSQSELNHHMELSSSFHVEVEVDADTSDVAVIFWDRLWTSFVGLSDDIVVLFNSVFSFGTNKYSTAVVSVFLIDVVILCKEKMMPSGRYNYLNSMNASGSFVNHLHSRIFYRREINIKSSSIRSKVFVACR